ncbi:substrate-binding domain-containing protein [Cellulomonas sp. URHE0023]|uniref:substrate-binding domain-containing protein n=1 Tax=Cellulomonas sp. URHE0023 TaxID=1380354 RepID=UPI00068C8A66|nr:substrate-binding domain-containing protein [Cellulomonas sp. URHE0023]
MTTTPEHGRGPLQVTRRRQLLDALHRDGTVRVSDLTESLGAAAVTIRRDIAQLADEGVVRRVHGGATLVREDVAAATGALAVTGAVGMLVPSLDYYWPGVVRGAEEAASRHGLTVVMRGSGYDVEDDLPHLVRLVEQIGVSALAVAPRLDATTTEHTLAWLAESEVPVVLVERSATVGPHHAVMESVVSDHTLGGAMAVRHLASLGHRRVGLLLPQHSPTGGHIRRGWLLAAQECGFDPGGAVDAVVPEPREQWDSALDAVLDECLRTGTTALVVHADAEAMALVQRCEDRDISVPGDLSVVAYDDEVAALFSPALTAVRPPRRSLGRAAVELVAARLADPGRPTHRVVISPSLRVRESSAPPSRH